MSQYMRLTFAGVNLDVDPIDLPPSTWTESGNMVSRPGAMARARGWVNVYDYPLWYPYHLMYTPQLGEPWWIYCAGAAMGVVDPAGNHTDPTPTGMGSGGNVPPDGWSGGNLNGIAILNSLQNPPYYWYSGIAANTAAELPGMRASTRYRVMRPFKYHLIGMGVLDAAGDYRDAVHWSNAADPGQVPDTWVPGPDNEAGDNVLADEDGDIIDGLQLRDSFFIYKQDSIYEMTYIGGSNVFRFRKVFGTTGVLTKNCIARVKGTHVVLGNGDIYQHDGQNMQSIVDGKVRRAFFGAIDDDNYKNSFVVYSEADEEVWFCVPATGEEYPSVALVWSVTTNEFGYRSLPNPMCADVGVIAPAAAQTVGQAWDDDAQAWNEDTSQWGQQDISSTEDAIMMGAPGLLEYPKAFFYKMNTSTTWTEPSFPGDPEYPDPKVTPYTSRVERLGLDLEDPAREKAIRRIWPRINAPSGTTFTLQLFNQRDPMSGQEQIATQDFEPGTTGVAVNCNARYLGIRISTDASVDWDIQGFDVEYLTRGYF